LSIFEQVKAAITLKQAAEYYGVKAGKGNMACCPFHNDRHPQFETERGLFLLLRLWGTWRCD
jgi:DNA primase